MSRATKPRCQTLLVWLKANGLSLAPLTGTDFKALAAAVHILELYATCSEDEECLTAFAAVVRCMQPSTQEYAYHAIAYLMEWDTRPRVWIAAGLEFPETIHRLKGER